MSAYIFYPPLYVQVTWGISCGVPLVDAEGSSCQALTTADSDGYLCTCNTSWCNNIDRCINLYLYTLH